MKQVVQDLRSGVIDLPDVPSPAPRAEHMLIRSRTSLISAGTERMLLQFGRASYIQKARQQPDKVRMVLDKIRTDGLMPTIDSVRSKLDQPMPLGYCNVGRILAVGAGVAIQPGRRVVSNGCHSQIVHVAKNLCALVPDEVDDEAAAFTVLAAIALQGIRLASPTLGEYCVVTGLGLVGMLAVQLLRAQGCRVLGIDFNTQRLGLARQFGAETVDLGRHDDPVEGAMAFSHGRGVDAVFITAATRSSEPVQHAARMSRQRGRIVLVGVSGLELSRDDFYKKELSFQVSCSYGPGRYDPAYEEAGQDYPYSLVRWTAQRNFEAVLALMADRRIDVAPLITHRFAIADASHAYDLIDSGAPSLGVLLQYPAESQQPDVDLSRRSIALVTAKAPMAPAEPTVSFLGAGSYASKILLPAFQKAGATFRSIASSGGLTASVAGRRFGFQCATTDVDAVLADPEANAVVIATRHDSHARLVCAALAGGKHVFVEKPLALSHDEIVAVQQAYAESRHHAAPPLLMVGFNRRFAPHVRKIRSLLQSVRGPKSFVMTVNAGAIPADHWTQDPNSGGGRIAGEGCHFIDLLRFLAGSAVNSFQVSAIPASVSDIVTFNLSFADGSIAAVHYFANGHKAFPKERLEIFCAGRVLQLDNFRKLRGYGWPGFSRLNLFRQDKGNAAAVAAFLEAIRNGEPSPIPPDELFEVARITVDIAAAASGHSR